MASSEQFVARILSNWEKILRYAWIPQLFAGLVFLGLGYFMAGVIFSTSIVFLAE